MKNRISIWLSDPKNASRLHLILTLFWTISLIPTILWWKNSILWVGIMSCWANVAAHWASYQGSCAEIATGQKKKIDDLHISSMISENVTKEIIREWIEKRGHDRCWYYPDLFMKLAEHYDLKIGDDWSELPSRYEFERGCRRFQDEEYGVDESKRCSER